MTECYCNIDGWCGWHQCAVCLKEFNAVELIPAHRRYRCHQSYAAMIDAPDYICDECTMMGWVYMVKYKGRDILFNTQTCWKLQLADDIFRKYWNVRLNAPISRLVPLFDRKLSPKSIINWTEILLDIEI